MEEAPFRDVYIHALVRDEKGQKMSKSKGNVIDPLDLIDTYGADALRFTLAAMAAQGRDIKLSSSRVEGYRNFATKLWNAARFAEINNCVPRQDFDPATAKVTLNRWIAGESERTLAAMTEALQAFRFNEAAGAIYHFIWHVYCDWYLELSKPILAGNDDAAAETRAMTDFVLDRAITLLHPFMPFVTEELWAKRAPAAGRPSFLMLAPWPEHHGLADAEADAEIGWLIKLISEVRSVRASSFSTRPCWHFHLPASSISMPSRNGCSARSTKSVPRSGKSTPSCRTRNSSRVRPSTWSKSSASARRKRKPLRPSLSRR
jgi:valyl-tRNA synthetase